MSVDQNTAKHVCNVIRRQVQSGFPNLYVHFVVHAEDGREKAFSADTRVIKDHPAGKYFFNYPDKNLIPQTLKRNKNQFSFMAYQNSPGVLGLFQTNSFFALCFLNYSHFENVEHLRNHAYHLAWHAIALYKDYMSVGLIDEDKDKESDSDDIAPNYTDNSNILIHNLNTQKLYHRNLMGDIFSASAQTLFGKKQALENLYTQRVNDTLNAETGFFAEQFPFPMCIETLEFAFKDNVERHKKDKNQLLSAVKITEEIGNTYSPASIEQWRSFSYPAQQMAWAGHDAQTILGAALYTGENTYAQSIADMVSEKCSTKPRVITSLQSHNPFTEREANTRMHRKLCIDLLNNLLNRISKPGDHTLVLEVIEKQNLELQKAKTMGWCVPALLPLIDLIHDCTDNSMFEILLNEATELFKKEVLRIEWDTLSHLSRIIFKHRRNGTPITMELLREITSSDEELSSISYGLVQSEKLKNENPAASTSDA